jgi:hypothetical protein
MIKALFASSGTLDADLFVFTNEGFTLGTVHSTPNNYAYLIVDIPLPADGSTQLKYNFTSSLAGKVFAAVLGYYEGLA